jgi:phage gp29-like protein
MKVTKKAGNSAGNLIIQQTVLAQIRRSNVAINKWRQAIQSAESISNPNRSVLYDLYSDVEIDAHLTSVIEKRKAAILKMPISFTRNGKEDQAINEQLDSPWFFNFLSDLLDTPFWGHSLFQFYKEGEWINYDLIPRKHVKPELGIWIKNQNDTTGESYKDGLIPNVLEVGYKKPLGLLASACPWVIYKRNGVGDYAQFVELFGQPIREGTYDGYDEEMRKKLESDMANMGSSAWIVHPKGTEIKFIDTPFKASSDSAYTNLVNLCDSQISKLVLGNTLTTDAGEKGARSLGDTQKESEEDIFLTDTKLMLNVLNFNMTDIFISLGINTTGGKFGFKNKTLSPEKRIDVDVKLSEIIPLDPDELYEFYGRNKPANYEAMKKEMDDKKAVDPQPMPKDEPKDEKPKNKSVFSFFA